MLDVAVVGKPEAKDSVQNELPWAFVVPEDGNLSDDRTPELLEYVNSRVAGYKKIRGVTWTNELPRSAAGKILKRELRASFK